ncbi:MAG: YsnF/AvaK domain-containing protein [Chloroflexota bacterium]
MKDLYVVDYEETRGLLASLDEKQAIVQLEGDRIVLLPRTVLLAQEDGNYRVPFSLTRFHQDGTMVVPVIEEVINVDKHEIEHTVRISKTVRTEDIMVDEPLTREDIVVEHIAINRYVDEPLPVRHEGDTTIIPLVEEVLVVEKRLLLREEIRITRQKSTISNPQVHTLRREDVQIDRDGETKPEPT